MGTIHRLISRKARARYARRMYVLAVMAQCEAHWAFDMEHTL